MVDHNRLEEIQPGAFSQLGFLNLLSLTHNQLSYIPNMAFQVTERLADVQLCFVLSEFERNLPPFRDCRTSSGSASVTTL